MIPEIGVIQKRKGDRWTMPATVAAADAFAETVAARYAANGITASGVELALAYEPPRQTNYFQDGAKIEVFPAVTVQEQRPFSAVARDTASLPGTAVGYGQAQAEALFQRLFSRHARVAAFAPGSAPQAVAANDIMAPLRHKVESKTQASGVERVVQSAAGTNGSTANGSGSVKAAAPAPRDMDWGTPAVLPAKPAAFTLPAPEVKRVADQVMREIDHRIAARRERTGRR